MRFLNKGKRVKMLYSDNVEKGKHQIVWDKTHDSNRKVAAGEYIIAVDK